MNLDEFFGDDDVPGDDSDIGGDESSDLEETGDESKKPDEQTPPEGESDDSADSKDEDSDSDQDQDEEVSYEDFSIPEGMQLDSDLLEDAQVVFKEDGLSQEQAQKYVDIFSKGVAKLAAANAEKFESLKEEWAGQSKSDDEIGGDAFDENLGIAKQALDKFGTPELNKLLRDYGMGNHPEVIRMMVKVGKLTLEDNPGGGTPPGGEKPDRASTLYPDD